MRLHSTVQLYKSYSYGVHSSRHIFSLLLLDYYPEQWLRLRACMADTCIRPYVSCHVNICFSWFTGETTVPARFPSLIAIHSRVVTFSHCHMPWERYSTYAWFSISDIHHALNFAGILVCSDYIYIYAPISIHPCGIYHWRYLCAWKQSKSLFNYFIYMYLFMPLETKKTLVEYLSKYLKILNLNFLARLVHGTRIVRPIT